MLTKIVGSKLLDTEVMPIGEPSLDDDVMPVKTLLVNADNNKASVLCLHLRYLSATSNKKPKPP